MASKKSSVPPKGEDLLASFDELGLSNKAMAKKAKAANSDPAKEPVTTATNSAASTSGDPLADLENLARSRPETPQPGASKRPGPTSIPRASEEKPRKSMESGRSFRQGMTSTDSEPATGAQAQESDKEAEKVPEPEIVEQSTASESGGGGGGWWGGIGGLMGAASAAVKQAQTQAEQIAKELQRNEEAQKWADHVKGNAALLRSYGGDLKHLTSDLRSRALPGLTNLLHTLAPPISSHEQLQVHITHDLVGYPSLDPLVHAVFARVMAQVEGGDLLVIQRGHEAGPSSSSGGLISSSAGWSDGPWWRDVQQRRDIGAVAGLVEGSKLVRASAEGYSTEYFNTRGGIQAARQQAGEALSESNPTRSSDIFLAVQAVRQSTADELFAGSTSSEKAPEDAVAAEQNAEDKDELLFAIYLHDPVHSLSFGAVTQAMPARWISWLNLPEPMKPGDSPTGYLPQDISELIAAGGMDPREWVAEWLEESLALGVGVVAQRYVARRMGVGEGGVAQDAVQGVRTGKAEEAGAGELARAI